MKHYIIVMTLTRRYVSRKEGGRCSVMIEDSVEASVQMLYSHLQDHNDTTIKTQEGRRKKKGRRNEGRRKEDAKRLLDNYIYLSLYL